MANAPKPAFLRDLAPKQKREIRQLIKEAGGRLCILVHPFYPETDPAEQPVRNWDSYLPRLAKLVGSKRVGVAVVFEENEHVDRTHARLAVMAGAPRLVYVPTLVPKEQNPTGFSP